MQKIKFTLREVLGIAKKDFYKLIIDVIKRKRQKTMKAVMVLALDIVVNEDEEEELGQVFQQVLIPKKIQNDEANVNHDAMDDD